MQPVIGYRRVLAGLAAILSVSLYGPLVLWAGNAWEISAPERLLLAGLVVATVAGAVYVISLGAGVSWESATIFVTGISALLLNWNRLPIHPAVSIVLIVVLGAFARSSVGPALTRVAVVAIIALLLVAPGLQVVVAHFQNDEPYPIIALPEASEASVTGHVEDVVLVVVDSYPSLSIAEQWFHHDTNTVRDGLDELGFTTHEIAWSQHTFTGLAVPSLVELQPVVESGPTGSWGNRLSAYEIIRGDSLVADALRDAGYRYTHVESGWDAGACGDVDVCLETSWLDEPIWELIGPTVGGEFVRDQFGSHAVRNSLRVVSHLENMASAFDDGQHDYVFAHMLLPHSPFVVGSDCELSRDSVSRTELDAAREQIECVDRLILRIAGLAGPNTAILITGDHGTGTGGQVGRPPASWTDADIAERLGIFLAYRLPAACREPTTAVNTDVMRAIIACSVNMEMPERNSSFLIGASPPTLVSKDRLARITVQIQAGSLSRDSTDG